MMSLTLNFESAGNPNHPALIILHGFFASSRNWRQIAEKLAENYRVLVPDLRNHGASPQHSVMDYPSMTADLVQFIDQQQLSQVSLLGHSMGGKLAMWFAFQHPAQLNKLIVADIAPVTYPHSFDRLINALNALPLAQLSNRKQAELLLAEAIPELSYRQFLLQNLILENAQYRWRINLDFFRANASSIAGFPDTSQLCPYEQPALFLAGANSNYVSANDIAVLFPQAIFRQIPDAGHWLHVQQPAAFISQVLDFLDAH
ncbi:MAG: alpha/beta fold hydrolase [Methylovulum sp.]|jgi:pimeloyl-ACP methyl ester carboxylesterase|nr:alpha/beta fold hydrolase [Methylovulum sp.]MCF7999885.1 alpha/beta fold hydrolase [Methylovulum sp.]